MVNHPNRSKRDPANRLGLVRIAIRSLKDARDALRAARCPHAASMVTRAITSSEGAEKFLEEAGDDGLDDLVTKTSQEIEAVPRHVRVYDTQKRRFFNGVLIDVMSIDDDGKATTWRVRLNNGTVAVYGRDHIELLP